MVLLIGEKILHAHLEDLVQGVRDEEIKSYFTYLAIHVTFSPMKKFRYDLIRKVSKSPSPQYTLYL